MKYNKNAPLKIVVMCSNFLFVILMRFYLLVTILT